MTTNLISDQVTTLNLQGYVGNALVIRLVVLGDSDMPGVVVAKAFSSPGGLQLPAGLQPTCTITDRVITITYAPSQAYPESGFQQIKFDGRIVLAGSLAFNRNTVNSISSTNYTITISDTLDVSLAVLGSDVLATWSTLNW